MKIKPFRVSEVNAYIRKILYNNAILGNIHIVGEVKGLKKTNNGYYFFDLIEGESLIKCIIFDNTIEIEDGKEIIASGKIESYDKRSIYQLVVTDISDKLEGEDAKLLSILKKKLEKKGYFEKSLKKKVPDYCQKIGIITSLSGEVLQDMLRVFNEKSFNLELIFYDSNVQGRTAALNIISGIKNFNKINNIDVIIIARGGGSKVDLSAFNDEVLADEIFLSRVPVITGIGHGTDMSLADLTADMEFQTPTAAAEFLMRKYMILVEKLESYPEYLYQSIKSFYLHKLSYVNNFNNYFNFYDVRKKFLAKKQMLLTLFYDLNNIYKKIINLHLQEIYTYKEQLAKCNYKELFNKGFVYMEGENGNFIKSFNDLKVNDIVYIRNTESAIKSLIMEIQENENED